MNTPTKTEVFIATVCVFIIGSIIAMAKRDVVAPQTCADCVTRCMPFAAGECVPEGSRVRCKCYPTHEEVPVDEPATDGDE